MDKRLVQAGPNLVRQHAMTLAATLSEPVENRITSLPARRCEECGGLTFFAAAGRLGCRECEAGAAEAPEAAWFDAVPFAGRLRYTPVDRSRFDPPASAATLRLYVSPSLESFDAPLTAGLLTAAEIEARDGTCYRLLDRAYFDWLAGTLNRAIARRLAPLVDLADTLDRLTVIARGAVSFRILGPWAADPANWPAEPPQGYRPPARSPEIAWGNVRPLPSIDRRRLPIIPSASRPAPATALMPSDPPKPPDPGLERRLLFVPCPGVAGEYHLAYLSPCRRVAHTACRMVLFLDAAGIVTAPGEPRGSVACPVCTTRSAKWFDKHFAGRRFGFRRGGRDATASGGIAVFPEDASCRSSSRGKTLL